MTPADYALAADTFTNLAIDASMKGNDKAVSIYSGAARHYREMMQQEKKLDLQSRAQATKEDQLRLAREKFEAAERRLNATKDVVCNAKLTPEEKLAELEAWREAKAKAALPAVEVEPQLTETVDFDTFCRSDFRAVKVKDCQKVKKSDKLLRFTLDDGTGVDRQILSGIAKYYEPEALIGKTLVAIVNLPPRKMMGLESCGMLISAIHTEHGEERLNLLMVDDAIPAGAKLC